MVLGCVYGKFKFNFIPSECLTFWTGTSELCRLAEQLNGQRVRHHHHQHRHIEGDQRAKHVERSVVYHADIVSRENIGFV